MKNFYTIRKKISNALIASKNNDLFPDSVSKKKECIELLANISSSSDTKFGDYQSNAAMTLAKIFKKSPKEIATTIINKINTDSFAEEPSIAGVGFINFTIKNKFISKQLSEIAQKGIFLRNTIDKKTIIIDFSSPNIAKPMHVGHLRSTIIGDSLANIAKFIGHNVITDNHIGDWGTQFGMIIYAWKNLLNKDNFKKDANIELLRIYKEVNLLSKENSAILNKCRNELKKLQSGDAENIKIWDKCINISKKSLEKIYDRLDIKFDHWLGESFYNDKLEETVDNLLKLKLARKSEGAICIFFPEDENLDDKPCIIKKSDGAFLYATTDLATINYRMSKWHPDEIWYVVGAPQSLHFQQIFKTCKMQKFSTIFYHIPFGSILDKNKKIMRTREGDNVGLESLLDESEKRALKIIQEKKPDYDIKTQKDISKIIGLASIKYAELSQHRMTDYVFEWDKMLSFSGNTAPYLIYSYVRAASIFRKLANNEKKIIDNLFEEKINIKTDFIPFNVEIIISDNHEKQLGLKILQYFEFLEDSLENHRPNILANYIYDLAKTFHSFYESCPILKPEINDAKKYSRLALVKLTMNTLESGLNLLGIEVPEKM